MSSAAAGAIIRPFLSVPFPGDKFLRIRACTLRRQCAWDQDRTTCPRRQRGDALTKSVDRLHDRAGDPSAPIAVAVHSDQLVPVQNWHLGEQTKCPFHALPIGALILLDLAESYVRSE